MRAGAALVLEYDLAASPDLTASVVNGESGAYQLGATEVLRTTIEKRSGGIWIQATLTDNATQQNRHVFTSEAKPDALINALDELAKHLAPRATTFSTRSIPAFQAFSQAAQSPSPQARAQLLNKAISVDPAFGLGYLILLEGAGNTTEQALSATLAQATARQSSFTAIDRARLRVITTRLTHAPLDQQATAAAALLQLTPNNLDALAALGSDRFLMGDAEPGERLLNLALELSPGNASIRDRLAQGLIASKRYAQAQKLIANRPELAICILLEGDTKRANEFANGFITSLPNPEVKTFFQATWLALSGQLPSAIQTLEKAEFRDPGARAVALSELALWHLRAGDLSAARTSAARVAASQTNTPLPVLAQLLTEDIKSPADWRARVEAAPLNSNAKQTLLGYGFFLRGNYPEAAEIWRQILSGSGDTDLKARAMLASSLDHAGRADEARKILAQPFLPEWGEYYAAISFNEMRRLLR